ncbi:hypothetical protein [Acrocarpospora sp. B8E8]|uniref:hypothetical protein n=1 Tax=Acrocarpospora sp. B8E8 TaxID=3153572 RepID=UPI00325E07D5
MITRKEEAITPLVIRAAVLLAAELFPNRSPAQESWRCRVHIADVHFLLTGQFHLWEQWGNLGPVQEHRIARVLRHRPRHFASRVVVVENVAYTLARNETPEFVRDGDDTLIVMPGRGQDGTIDSLLDRLDHVAQKAARRRDRARKEATAGQYFADIPIRDAHSPSGRLITAHYTITARKADGQRIPPRAPAADALELTVPFSELKDIAETLDSAYGEKHRTTAVKTFHTELRDGDGALVGDLWKVTSGPLRILHAPTGVGKNVLSELLACWAARNSLRMSLVVTRNAQVAAAVRRLRRDLETLGETADVVPLISPARMQTFAESAASAQSSSKADRDWAFAEMSYSCAIVATASVDQTVDAWQPGREPCTDLKAVRAPHDKPQRHICPWQAGCGKFRHHRAAITAEIIVTSHHNFLLGKIHTRVLDTSGLVRDDLRVEEHILNHSHFVLIDEVDGMQSTGFEQASGAAVLSKYGAPNDLTRDLETQFRINALHLDSVIEKVIHPSVSHLAWLSSSYVSHLARGVLSPRGSETAAGVSTLELAVPRRWDAWLAHLVFGMPEDQRITQEQMDLIAALYERDPKPFTEPGLPAGLDELHDVLARITDLTDGSDRLEAEAGRLTKIFKSMVSPPSDAGSDTAPAPPPENEEDTQARVTSENWKVAMSVQYAMRRAYLEKIRGFLNTISYSAAHLQAAGVVAGDKLTDAFANQRGWRASPYGPLGRQLFAFTEKHNPVSFRDTSLAVTSFSGDPHSHTAYLGDTTALGYAGRRRIVIGMSATAYLPMASLHHVMAKPSWYLPDDIGEGGLTIRYLPLYDGDGEIIKISGTSGAARDHAHFRMGAALWRRLQPMLETLRADPATRHQAHALIGVTAYQGAFQLADSMIDAGAPAEEIRVAVQDGWAPPTRTPRWMPLPISDLERFPEDSPGTVLIVPLPLAERGINIVDKQGRSLLGPVILAVRPIPVMDDAKLLLSLISAFGYTGTAPSADPAAALEALRVRAGEAFEEIRANHHYFHSLSERIRMSIVATMIVQMIQLGGRARRGGAHGDLYLADAAFTNGPEKSSLPYLVGQLRNHWQQTGDLKLLERIYGTTVTRAVFDLAEEAP